LKNKPSYFAKPGLSEKSGTTVQAFKYYCQHNHRCFYWLVQSFQFNI